ncbi:MAG: efflux RND transporter periplasmic adaptor subunit [Vicinamibacterales bacterium]
MTRTTRKRLAVWGTVGVFLLLALVLALMPQPIPVDFGEATKGPLQVTLDHEGMTRVRDRFVVSAPVAGRVLRIELEPGDPVSAGRTVLARFLPAAPVPLDERTRREAQARVQAARAALERARAERARQAAERDLAESEWERGKRLAEQGVIAEQERDRLETASRAAGRLLEAADAAVEAALHDLEAANAALLEPASAAPGSPSGALTLTSPIDGVVLRRVRESEAVVQPGEPLVEVGNPNDLEIVADYLSTDAVRIRPGMPVLVEQWGGGRTLRARVRRVEPAGFMKISALGVEEQRVWVVIDFENPEDAKALGDAYRVETRVVVWEQPDVLQVPTSAVFRQEGQWAAYAVENGRAVLRRVRIGERNSTAVAIEEGLSANDRVILHPPDTVTDGVQVTARGK